MKPRILPPWIVIAVLVLFAALPTMGQARVLLPQPCRMATGPAVTVVRVLAASPDGCAAGAVDSDVQWAVVRGLRVASRAETPIELRHANTQLRNEAVFVRYADGAIVAVSNDRLSARRTYSAGELAFALPQRDGVITAVAVRLVGLTAQRGPLPHAHILSRRESQADDALYLFVYGTLAGAVIALFAYNLALFAVLRARFILYYCASTTLMLCVGLCWTGGIFVFVPTLTTTTQVSLSLLSVSVLMLPITLFMLSFVGEQGISKPVARATVAAALVGIAASLARLADYGFAWRVVDKLTYGSIIAVLAGLFVTTAMGWRRGNRSARVYLIAWSVPLLLANWRALWALGAIPLESTLAEMSPLIIMAIEALMSAIAVGWKVGRIRSERDEARAAQVHLRHLSEIDDLTGLLNRRAFIDRARERSNDGPQRLVLVDVDRFKLVNDRHGHQVGDAVLVALAAVLRAETPAEAQVGRMGGEEFAILGPVDPLDALADRICRAVAAMPLADVAVTVSAGVAIADLQPDGAWNRLYYAADQALYRAKHGGRNRVHHAPVALAA